MTTNFRPHQLSDRARGQHYPTYRRRRGCAYYTSKILLPVRSGRTCRRRRGVRDSLAIADLGAAPTSPRGAAEGCYVTYCDCIPIWVGWLVWTSYGPDQEASLITQHHHWSTTTVGYGQRSESGHQGRTELAYTTSYQKLSRLG
jgi:hypothetical protein